MTEPWPERVVLPKKEYMDLLHSTYDMNKVWYYNITAGYVIPRGFVRREKDGTVKVVILAGNEHNRSLHEHEFGHVLGHHHPPVKSFEYWTDVMGYGLRIADKHGVRAKAKHWLNYHRV